MSTFLLELRCEEIPANALPGARRQLAEQFGRRLADAGVADAHIRTLSTSLRLAVLIDGLPERQEDRTEEMMGPPARIAFADDGTPTKAAEGFARKVGLTMDQVRRVETDKGEYLAATVTHPGRAMVELLGEAVPEIIGGLRFPKMMRWGLGEHHFVRPVHGLIALFDDVVVPCAVFGLEAGRETVGHRVHAPGAVTIESAEAYTDAMRAAMVSWSIPGERRSTLEERAAELAAEAGCRVHPTIPLWWPSTSSWWSGPACLAGRDRSRVSRAAAGGGGHHPPLSPEVPHPRERGRLSRPVSWRSSTARRSRGVGSNRATSGSSAPDSPTPVLLQRRSKAPMEAWFGGLDRLEFHRVLGSLAAKADGSARWRKLVELLRPRRSRRRGSGARPHLVKADLLTNMVVEFPSCRASWAATICGSKAPTRRCGPRPAITTVPSGFDGEIPRRTWDGCSVSPTGSTPSPASSAVGEIPSGSKDPLGLRRACPGGREDRCRSGLGLDLEAAVEAAVEGVGEFDGSRRRETSEVYAAFLADRVRRYLTDQLVGVSGDAADAVMAAGWTDLPELVARAEALDAVRTAIRCGPWPGVQAGEEHHRRRRRSRCRSGALRAGRGARAPRGRQVFADKLAEAASAPDAST
jgi:glycyl-tRNA synthetase beta chain